MGTQQILLIVLSVIIVGIAIAVGIAMFASQAETANRQALMIDLTSFGASSMAFWRMPTSMGGASSTSFGANIAAVRAGLGISMGFASDGTFTNENGQYTLGRVSASVITITGVGNELGADEINQVQTRLTISATDLSPLTTVIVN